MGPVSEQVRQAGLQGRQAWTEDRSTQFSRDRLRSCSPEVKPGGHNFTQPCRKREKPGLHSGWDTVNIHKKEIKYSESYNLNATSEESNDYILGQQ